MKKKNIFIISGIFSLVLLILDTIGTFQLCGGKEYSDCMVTLHDTLIVLVPVLPLFLFSLITYKMRDEVYQAWLRFVRWGFPLSLLGVIIAPSQYSDWMFPIDKGRVSLFLSTLFAIISLIIIVVKLWKLRK